LLPDSYEQHSLQLKSKIKTISTQVIQLNSLIIEYDQSTSSTNQAFTAKQSSDKKILREKIPEKISAISVMLKECREMMPCVTERNSQLLASEQ